MNASEGIQFIKAVKKLGIKEEAAEKIVSLVESQKGELATKADIDQLRQEGRQDIERLEASIEQLREGQKEQREQSRKEIEQAEKRLEASIDQLKEGQNEQRKANRWAIGIIVAAMIGGFTLQGMYIIAQISDLKADYRQSQPADQQPTDQTSASGRS